MSRGLGWVQRAILEHLEAFGPCDYRGLTEIYEVGAYEHPTYLASIKRACKRLEQMGKVERKLIEGHGYTMWDGLFPVIEVKLPEQTFTEHNT